VTGRLCNALLRLNHATFAHRSRQSFDTLSRTRGAHYVGQKVSKSHTLKASMHARAHCSTALAPFANGVRKHNRGAFFFLFSHCLFRFALLVTWYHRESSNTNAFRATYSYKTADKSLNQNALPIHTRTQLRHFPRPFLPIACLHIGHLSIDHSIYGLLRP